VTDIDVKFDHCVIHVSDWERSNLFYRDVLGAVLVDRGGGTWAYRFGGEQLNGDSGRFGGEFGVGAAGPLTWWCAGLCSAIVAR
jgi:catechol 2,3-dioxygenase-like lactoylglutathione lyase family enzyme